MDINVSKQYTRGNEISMSEQTPIKWPKPKNDFVFKLLFGSEDELSNQLLLAFFE
ncbi:hypothetical protein KHA80_13115 [Anaerobacillus sp. HL2]|nr:hypothetical protein KHA80_13115 [Anaerobacillus sp. HL2]